MFLLLSTLPGAAAVEALGAEPPGTPASRAAIALCYEAQGAPPEQGGPLIEQSLARAAEAIAADDRDALAHFARFCALGAQAKAAGVSIRGLWNLSDIRAAVDRTLAIEPDFPDALHGKGALLLSVPSLLGGDDEEGERLVRRALAIEPDYIGARLTLAEAVAARGDEAGARTEAARALAIAERKGDQERAAAARKLLEAYAP